MFRISRLIMVSVNDEKYTYNFKAGVNYFKGQNSSGKTVFYDFIDYMFGSSEDISKKVWFKDSLKRASMEIYVDNIKYVLTRTMNPNHNYLTYAGEEDVIIDKREYVEKINSIFAKQSKQLKQLRKFTEEDLTYRTFTLFNFLGEKRQGYIQDFFDKCTDIKYSIKLSSILNYIFNNNLKEIIELQNELERLKTELNEIENRGARYKFICNQVNINIEKLGLNVWYNGKNADEIRKVITALKTMNESQKKGKEKNIAELEAMYSNISEQIKAYENVIEDSRQFEKDSNNRVFLLEKLNEVLANEPNFEYLITPLKNLLNELDETISFNKYTISDKTIEELKKQREKLKVEIRRNDSRFRCYTLDEKEKAIALVEDYLSEDIANCDEKIKELKNAIKTTKDKIKVLQNTNDLERIKEISDNITMLYKSAQEVSSVVSDDLIREGFKIKYIKKGNILQPMIEEMEEDENEIAQKKEVNYYTGSMARHTLMQLCGYLSFLKILLSEDKYPIIPILVIDHISKPFDDKNVRAIGKIIERAYEDIDKDNLQVFMFDDEDYTSLELSPDYSDNLVNENKSGFNPFYFNLGNE